MALTSSGQGTNTYSLTTPRQRPGTRATGGLFNTGAVGNVLGGAVGQVNPYAGVATQVGLNALTDLLASQAGGNSDIARTLFGTSNASPAGIGMGAIGGGLGGLANILISQSLKDKPYGSAAGTVGGYAVQQGTTAAANALATGTNFATNLGTNLVSGLPSLGLGLLTGLLTRKSDPSTQTGVSLLSTAVTPVISALLGAGEATAGAAAAGGAAGGAAAGGAGGAAAGGTAGGAGGAAGGTAAGGSVAGGLALPIAVALTILTSVWQNSKEQKALDHWRRRNRTSFSNYLTEADPAMTELRENLQKTGPERLNALEWQGITNPDLLKAAYGLGSTGYTAPEEFVQEHTTEEWMPEDPEQQMLLRMATGSPSIREVAYANKLSNAPEAFTNYSDLVSQMITNPERTLTPEMESAIQNFWGHGFTGYQGALRDTLDEQERNMANMMVGRETIAGPSMQTYQPRSFESWQRESNIGGDPALRNRLTGFMNEEYLQPLREQAMKDYQAKADAIMSPYETKRQEILDIFDTMSRRTLSPYGRQTSDIIRGMEQTPELTRELEAMSPEVQKQLETLQAQGLDIAHDPTIQTYLEHISQQWQGQQRQTYNTQLANATEARRIEAENAMKANVSGGMW